MTWQMPPSFAKEPDFCIQLERINFFLFGFRALEG
jgi:hypothetical protein